MPKQPPARKASRSHHHNPLATDIIESQSTLARPKANTGRKGREREERRLQSGLDRPSRIDRSILDQAKEQQREEAPEIVPKSLPNYADSDDEDEFTDGEVVADVDVNEELLIDEADAEALSMFMKKETTQRKTIADIVMEKLREQEMQANQPQQTNSTPGLHPKVVQVYKGVGKVMSHYTAGKVPKAFKIIPSLNNWEEIVYLTDPSSWSLPAYYVATRLFASNLNEKMAQRFYNTILFPRVMDDITENKRLNYHLYRALKKAVYKPAAFYKGIILPLCEQQCTLHEAAIIASVIKKVSVPVLQSSAALYKMTQMEYNGTVNIFMKVLLTKKYALPYRVIDRLVEYFNSFIQERRELPVIWHQAVLIFAQRYKEDLTKEQKEAIKAVIKAHTHTQITPEIRRELDNSASRGEVLTAEETAQMMLE